MSISSAMQSGVSGLQANSRAVQSISENIANSNTVGYRRAFSHMVTNTAAGASGASSSTVSAVDAIDIDSGGALIVTNSATDMAISGNGFFVVSPNPNETVSANYLLTRAGSFTADAEGNLVNAAGYYLAGFPYDTDGMLSTIDRNSFSSMETVNVANLALTLEQSTSVGIMGNLPSQESGQASPGAPFTSSVEFFTALGASERVEFSWQPTSTENQWEVSFSDHTGTALGTVTVDFHDSGALAGAPATFSNITSLATAPSAFSFDATTGEATLTLDTGSAPQAITVSLGAPDTFDGVTQFAGDFSQSFDADGQGTGELLRTELDSSGTLFGVFDNGERQPLFEIPVGVVANPSGLTLQDGNAFSLTREAGEFFASLAGTGAAGSIYAEALENSNVDIAEEMTDLIEVQRAYSTNAKVVTTVDEMLEETTRLKR